MPRTFSLLLEVFLIFAQVNGQDLFSFITPFLGSGLAGNNEGAAASSNGFAGLLGNFASTGNSAGPGSNMPFAELAQLGLNLLNKDGAAKSAPAPAIVAPGPKISPMDYDQLEKQPFPPIRPRQWNANRRPNMQLPAWKRQQRAQRRRQQQLQRRRRLRAQRRRAAAAQRQRRRLQPTTPDAALLTTTMPAEIAAQLDRVERARQAMLRRHQQRRLEQFGPAARPLEPTTIPTPELALIDGDYEITDSAGGSSFS